MRRGLSGMPYFHILVQGFPTTGDRSELVTDSSNSYDDMRTRLYLSLLVCVHDHNLGKFQNYRLMYNNLKAGDGRFVGRLLK